MQYLTDDAQNDVEIAKLYARAFGPARFVKAAHFLRVGNVCDYELSSVCKFGDKIIGACRMWHIKDSHGNSAVFLGPIAVEKQYRDLNVGHELVDICLAACKKSGIKIVLLVGDYDYFSRFGFEKVPFGQVAMPLPVMDNRILWIRNDPQATLNGMLFPFPPPHGNP